MSLDGYLTFRQIWSSRGTLSTPGGLPLGDAVAHELVAEDVLCWRAPRRALCRASPSGPA